MSQKCLLKENEMRIVIVDPKSGQKYQAKLVRDAKNTNIYTVDKGN